MSTQGSPGPSKMGMCPQLAQHKEAWSEKMPDQRANALKIREDLVDHLYGCHKDEDGGGESYILST